MARRPATTPYDTAKRLVLGYLQDCGGEDSGFLFGAPRAGARERDREAHHRRASHRRDLRPSREQEALMAIPNVFGPALGSVGESDMDEGFPSNEELDALDRICDEATGPDGTIDYGRIAAEWSRFLDTPLGARARDLAGQCNADNAKWERPCT